MKCAAGITLYNPEISKLKENLDSIFLQVEKIFIVDNGSDNLGEIKDILIYYPDVVLTENKENLGIAKALNQICESALKNEYDWVITLDQDTVVSPRIIEKYSAMTEIPDTALITAILEDENETPQIESVSKTPFENVTRAITSGSFVKLSVWQTLGGFDEDMFIDCVDFDYCSTLIENGFVILRINEVLARHRLGEAKEVRFFMHLGRIFKINKLKKPFYTYNHSPLRTYYFARNIKYYWHKHKNSIDKKAEKRAFIKWVVLKLCFEKGKTAKLMAIVKGLKDAEKMIKKGL